MMLRIPSLGRGVSVLFLMLMVLMMLRMSVGSESEVGDGFTCESSEMEGTRFLDEELRKKHVQEGERQFKLKNYPAAIRCFRTVVSRGNIHPALSALVEIAKIETEVRKNDLRDSVPEVANGTLTVSLLAGLVTAGKLDEPVVRIRRTRPRVGSSTLAEEERSRPECQPITTTPPDVFSKESSASLRHLVGLIYSELGCHWEASLFFEHSAIVVSKTTDGRVFLLAGEEMLKAQEYEHGLLILRELVETNPHFLPARKLLAEYYEILGFRISANVPDTPPPPWDVLSSVPLESLLQNAARKRFEEKDIVGAYRSCELVIQQTGPTAATVLGALAIGQMFGRWLVDQEGREAALSATLDRFTFAEVSMNYQSLQLFNLSRALFFGKGWADYCERSWAVLARDYEQQRLKDLESPSRGPDGQSIPVASPLPSFEESTKKRLSQKEKIIGLEGNIEGRKLRIGYIGSEFSGEGPASDHLRGLIASHNTSLFEIFLYATSGSEQEKKALRWERSWDYFSGLCQQGFCTMRPVSHLDELTIDKIIRNDDVDVIINVSGYGKKKTVIATRNRPAPIQMNFLGWPSTLSAHWYDYLISHAVAAPLAYEKFYTEKMLNLPAGPFPSSHRLLFPEALEPKDSSWPTRKSLGLPEDAFIYASFNRLFKLDSTLFDAWMTILRMVPNSVLWLVEWEKSARETLFYAAEHRGVSRSRIVFTPLAPTTEEHLRVIHLADLALDPWVYNGGITTLNCLWAGLPVLASLHGKTYFQRMSAASLVSFDEELAVNHLLSVNMVDYQIKAIRLATTNRTQLAWIRQQVEAKRHTSLLFDIKGWTASLERGLHLAYQRLIKRLPPDHIFVQ